MNKRKTKFLTKTTYFYVGVRQSGHLTFLPVRPGYRWVIA
jgi:hypothetical protein